MMDAIARNELMVSPRAQFHNPSCYGRQDNTIRLEELQALSRRVKEILRQCTAKLAYSRSGLEDLFTKRQGFAQHLREAEDDFQRMGYDWRNIEDDLRSVRETLLAGGELSPRDRSRLLEMMGVSTNAPLDSGIAERARDGKFSPCSEDVSTEIPSTLTTDGVSKRKGFLKPELTEEASSTTVGAILAAAGRNSEADAIVEASKFVVDDARRSRMNEGVDAPGRGGSNVAKKIEDQFRGSVSNAPPHRFGHQRSSQIDSGVHHECHLEQDHLPPVPPVGASVAGLDEELPQSHHYHRPERRHGTLPTNPHDHRLSTPQQRRDRGHTFS
jgi:hypothetical protein